MENQFKESIIKRYENHSIKNLEASLMHFRKSFAKTQTEHDAVRCEVISQLIKQKQNKK